MLVLVFFLDFECISKQSPVLFDYSDKLLDKPICVPTSWNTFASVLHCGVLAGKASIHFGRVKQDEGLMGVVACSERES